MALRKKDKKEKETASGNCVMCLRRNPASYRDKKTGEGLCMMHLEINEEAYNSRQEKGQYVSVL